MAFIFIAIAAIIAALSVALGAFAAHGLQQHLSAYSLDVFKTAVQYQFIHALALFGLGIFLLVLSQNNTADVPMSLVIAGVAWLVGILLFSGSLYGLSLLQWRWFGPITPLGGICFIIGWISLAVGSWQAHKSLF